MLSDEQLGEWLRADLHAIAAEIEPSPELIARLVPDRHPRRLRGSRSLRVLGPAVVALTAGVVAVVLALGGSAASPAFALTVGGRSVRITVGQVIQVHALNRELERLGFPVRAVAMTADCRTPARVNLGYMGVSDRPGTFIRLLQIPHLKAGVTPLIAAEQISAKTVKVAVGSSTGAAPSCVSAHGIGPGLPGWHLSPKDRLPSGSP